MIHPNNTEGKNWGMVLNASKTNSYSQTPEWVNIIQREKFSERGLIVWDNTAKQVVNLKSRQILQIYDGLKSTQIYSYPG